MVDLKQKGLEFSKLLSPEVTLILDILQKHNKDAYIIGGAVRDFLLGYTVGDFDVATDALPEEISEWMNEIDAKTKPIGGDFGTVLVIIGKKAFDVSTYRTETFEVHGKPPTIVFVKSLADDLARRDFRLNAFVFDPKQNIILDPYDGLNDIQDKTINMIGDPNIRLKEDGLRIIRLGRFLAKFDMNLNSKILAAVQSVGKNAKFRNRRVVRNELLKLIKVSNPYQGIELLRKNDILHAIFPHFPFSPTFREDLIRDFSQLTVENEITKLFGFLVLISDGAQLTESHFKKLCQDLELSNKQEQQLERLYNCWKNFPDSPELQSIKPWVRATGINASEVLVHIYFLNVLKREKSINSDTKDEYLTIVRDVVKRLKTG